MEPSEISSSTNGSTTNHTMSGIVYSNTGNVLKYQSPKRKRNMSMNAIKKSNTSSIKKNGNTLDHQLLDSPNGSLILGLHDHDHNHNYDSDSNVNSNNNMIGGFNVPVSLSFAPSTSHKSKYNNSMSACNTTCQTTILNSSYGNSIISTPSSPSGPNKININHINHETSIDISHNSIQTEEISTISPVSSIASYAKYDEYDNSDVHETSGIAGIHALRSSVRSSLSSQSSHQSSGINTSSEMIRQNKLDTSMNSSTSTSFGMSIFSNFRVTNTSDVNNSLNQQYNNTAISPKLSDFSPNRNTDSRLKGMNETIFKSIDNNSVTGGSLGTVLRNSAIAHSCRSSCEDDDEELHHNDMIDDDDVSNDHQLNADGTVVRTRLRFTPLLRNMHHDSDIDTNSPNKNKEDNCGAMAGQMSGLHLRSKKIVNDSMDEYSTHDGDHDNHNAKSSIKLSGNILFMDTVSVSSTDDNDILKGPNRTRALSLDMYERSTTKISKSQQPSFSHNNSFHKGLQSDMRYPRIQGMQAAEMGDLGTPLSAKSNSPMIYMDTDAFIDDSQNISGTHDYIDQLSSFISSDSNDEYQYSSSSNTKNASKEDMPRRRSNRSESLGNYSKPMLSLSKGSKNRPLPDQSAFDKSITSNGKISSPSQSPVCPATPMRTPTWAHEVEAKDITNRITALGNPGLARQNSLVSNKLLLTQADTDDSCGNNTSADSNVSFTRDFENHGLLGSGTFADVYRVRAVDGSGYYAVKKSRRQFRSKKDREWLLSEVRVMKRLGVEPCANIVQLIKAWQENGYFYVQIDLAEKGTLRDLIIYSHTMKHSISDETIWKIMHDASSGLQHIHKFGMVHLDVKPANLLIADGGVVKIGDFGMTTEQGRGDDGHEGDTIYMAPELLDSCDRFPPADIFSLGLTLYELCMADGRLENYSLPSEGIAWHALREGRAEGIPNRSPVLCGIIQEKMIFPSPFLRPTSSQILALPEVKAMKSVVDPLLNNSQPIQVLRRRNMGSSSLYPTLTRDFGLNIQANLNLVNPGDIASLRNDDRVRTPTGEMGYYRIFFPNNNSNISYNSNSNQNPGENP